MLQQMIVWASHVNTRLNMLNGYLGNHWRIKLSRFVMGSWLCNWSGSTGYLCLIVRNVNLKLLTFELISVLVHAVSP